MNFKFDRTSGRVLQSPRLSKQAPEFAEGLKSGKDNLMPNLSVGITKFKKQEIRRIGQGFGGYMKRE